MNTRREPRAVEMAPQVLAEIERITTIWKETRERFGGDGPFLYGRFCAADAVYAPIVNRFHGYDVSVPHACRPYMDAIRELPSYKAWVTESFDDPWRNATTDAL